MRTAAAFLLAVATLSGQPKILDAKLETRPLAQPQSAAGAGGSPLLREVAAAPKQGPSWIAWRIATHPNAQQHQMCCFLSDRCSLGCSLVDGNYNGDSMNCTAPPAGTPTARLEGYREAYVFVRIEEGQVNRIRTYSPDCEVHGGGLPVTYLTEVPTAVTLAFFQTFVNWDSGRLAEHSVNVIGLLDAPEVMPLLEQYTTASGPPRVRRQAAYWMAQANPQRAVPMLSRLAMEDPEPKFREHCVYLLSLSKPGTAVLLSIANRKVAVADPKVREKAVFWLARSQEPEARRYIDGLLSR